VAKKLLKELSLSSLLIMLRSEINRRTINHGKGHVFLVSSQIFSQNVAFVNLTTKSEGVT
jgi:hypothetical protein